MTEPNNTAQLAPEDAPSLGDLATPEEGSGAWPKGWYRATIIDGYTTGKGKIFETKDALANDPASRNLFVCVKFDGAAYVPVSHDPGARVMTKGPGGERNIRGTLNYRPSDFGRIAEIKAAREQYKYTSGAWPDKSIQAASLSLGRLGQLEKALGFKLPRIGDRFDVSRFVGQRLDVRLNIDEKGFNEVAAFAAFGSKVK